MTDNTNIAEPLRKPRRRWFQFRLRTLLIVVALLGCGLGWLGIKSEDARKQRAAVAAIEKLGGAVSYDCDFDSQGNFVYDAVPPGPAWLRAILGDDCFRNVRTVSFALPDGATIRVPDVELENLRVFVHLKELNLTGTQASDAGLGNLDHSAELEVLDLSYTKMTDAGFEHLRGLTQLTSLRLSGTQVSDAGLTYLKNFTKLDELSLANTKITDKGLEFLSGLTRLKMLDLSLTQVGDAGLDHLQGLTQLNSLILMNTQTTDAGLHYLAGLSHLKSLYLNYTKVTKTGVETLQAALPNCEIEQ